MRWHFIEGAEGCRFARENNCAAVVVDALRASATAAYFLESGARELWVVGTVDAARTLKDQNPDVLLAGERGGLPPEGFDLGNSPREASGAKDRVVVFTTSNGSARLVDAVGADSLYLGTTVNALATVQALLNQSKDVVLIPAGKADDPDFDAQEDWAAAAAIAMMADPEAGEGAVAYRHWRARVENEGLASLFESAPHSDALRQVNLEADIPFCAQMNTCSSLPQVAEVTPEGYLRVVDAR